ncbi:hypothetical protein [Sphingopyxis fribergensis]
MRLMSVVQLAAERPLKPPFAAGYELLIVVAGRWACVAPLCGRDVAGGRWWIASNSYLLRIQRLIVAARHAITEISGMLG